MSFFKLSPADQAQSLMLPEQAANVQWAYDVEHWYVVIGSEGALRLDDDIGFNLKDYLTQDFVQPGVDHATRIKLFDRWLDRFQPTSNLNFWAPGGGGSGPITHPVLGAIPKPPPVIYGHCLFSTTTANDAVFYRYEHWPRSRRIDRQAKTIAQDTFASPASEVQFMPSGFAAVGRCALPSLLPAIHRYELQPVGGTNIACGASVPLYGQSGGGVEVKFTDPLTNNRCEIADPVYIPAL